MVVELTIENIELLNDSFLLESEVLENFSNNPFARYLVYLKFNKVTGYIYYSDIYERCEINKIEVVQEERGNGIGSKLMEELIIIVDKNITLEVRIDNIIAIKMYEKFNFIKKAIRNGYYNGIDGILMERDNNMI